MAEAVVILSTGTPPSVGRAQCGPGVADGWQADGIGVNRWPTGGLGRIIAWAVMGWAVIDWAKMDLAMGS